MDEHDYRAMDKAAQREFVEYPEEAKELGIDEVKNPAVFKRYIKARMRGESKNFAEMMAWQEGPAGSVSGSSTPCAKRRHKS